MGADANTTAATAATVTPPAAGTRPTIPTEGEDGQRTIEDSLEVTSDRIKLEDVNNNLQLGDIPLDVATAISNESQEDTKEAILSIRRSNRGLVRHPIDFASGIAIHVFPPPALPTANT